MFQFVKALLSGGDLAQVPPPFELPNGGIYHPDYEQSVFASLPDYLAWWQKRHGKVPMQRPVIGMEISSSYISDGQTRVMDEVAASLEAAGALPVLFYRTARLANQAARLASTVVAPVGRRPAAAAGTQTEASPAPGSGRPAAAGRAAASAEAFGGNGFPNPRPTQVVDINEPLIMQDGKPILNVLMVNTFLGSNPEGRKAWHQAMGIPVINVIAYRSGTRADYYKDTVGVSSFFLPYTLTTAEYIGLQGPGGAVRE